MSQFNRLYDEVIKQHNSQPYHFEIKTNLSQTLRAYNPICGDRFDLFIDFDGQTIKAVYFHGFGCAVSKASSSILTKTLEGKTIAEARQVCSQFLRLLKTDLPDEMLTANEFKSFAVVKEVPARYECAALAWNEMDKYLSKKPDA